MLDTSVLVAAMIESHPAHRRALPWLEQAKRGEVDGCIASHTLAELYAVLTRLPMRPLITPSLAWQLVQENVLSAFEVIPLLAEDYRAVLEHLSQIEARGGVTYDALIAHAALKSKVDKLVTLNERDFSRLYSELSEYITVP